MIVLYMLFVLKLLFVLLSVLTNDEHFLTAQSSSGSSSAASSRPPSRSVQVNAARLPSDEQLGFEAAVTALGLKANISEAQHPLICEGTRRQKGDLAIALLVQYKEDQYKLDKVIVTPPPLLRQRADKS